MEGFRVEGAGLRVKGVVEMRCGAAHLYNPTARNFDNHSDLRSWTAKGNRR